MIEENILEEGFVYNKDSKLAQNIETYCNKNVAKLDVESQENEFNNVNFTNLITKKKVNYLDFMFNGCMALVSALNASIET